MNRESKILNFNLCSGISGDMMLGALIDLGVEPRALRKELRKLPLKGWRLRVEKVARQGLIATKATVVLAKSVGQPHRHYSGIRRMIEETPLPDQAARWALKAFALLGKAEAAAHDIPISKVHFHEVGAVDAIIDIVGSMIGVQMLGARQFSASTVVVGSGQVRCSHGVLPVPAPATARLLEGAPIEAGPVEAEMTTPTGAAILMALSPRFGPLGAMRMDKSGLGAGSREFPGRTNCLRLLLGSPLRSQGEGALERSTLCLLTTEIDDMNPEFYAPLLERLFESGCLDAVLAPITMKKGRPGVSVRVLTDEARREKAIEVLLRHSSTFGVKAQEVERFCLRRKAGRVETPFGSVRTKIGYWGDDVLKVTPEYEDCRRRAQTTSEPIGRIYEAAMLAIARDYPAEGAGR